MARPKRDPYIYKIGDNYWAFFSRDDRRSLNTKDPKEAAQNFASNLQNYGLRQVLKRETTFAKIAETTVKRLEVTNSDKYAYVSGGNLKRVSEFLDSIDIDKPHQITKDSIEKFKAHRINVNKVGASRVNSELISWKNALRVAIEFEEAKPEILDAFTLLSEPKPDPRRVVHKTEDLERFVSSIDIRYRPLIKVTLGSAIRDDEARHLQIENVKVVEENKKYTLTVTPLEAGKCDCHPKGWNTKNYRYRTIPISKATYEHAIIYCNTRNTFNLHKDTSARTVWGKMQKAFKDASMPVINAEETLSLHDLRHACASYWVDFGYKPATVQQWLGHADLETTLRYIHGIDLELPESTALPF